MLTVYLALAEGQDKQSLTFCVSPVWECPVCRAYESWSTKTCFRCSGGRVSSQLKCFLFAMKIVRASEVSTTGEKIRFYAALSELRDTIRHGALISLRTDKWAACYACGRFGNILVCRCGYKNGPVPFFFIELENGQVINSGVE